MTWKGKTQRQIHGLVDADARSLQHFANRVAVVTHLKRRMRIDQITLVVCRAAQPQRLAKPAGPRSEHSRRCPRRKPAISSHLLHSCQRFQRAQQHAARLPLRLATDIHAEVAAINGINIRMTRGTK